MQSDTICIVPAYSQKSYSRTFSCVMDEGPNAEQLLQAQYCDRILRLNIAAAYIGVDTHHAEARHMQIRSYWRVRYWCVPYTSSLCARRKFRPEHSIPTHDRVHMTRSIVHASKGNLHHAEFKKTHGGNHPHACSGHSRIRAAGNQDVDYHQHRELGPAGLSAA